MGILEDIMAKMDQTIEALNENTKARLAGGGDAPADKPKATRTAKTKDEPAAPKATAEQVDTKFKEIQAANPSVNTPKLKKLIADLGFTSLAELKAAPAKFDEAMTALEALETELSAAAGGDDDL